MSLASDRHKTIKKIKKQKKIECKCARCSCHKNGLYHRHCQCDTAWLHTSKTCQTKKKKKHQINKVYEKQTENSQYPEYYTHHKSFTTLKTKKKQKRLFKVKYSAFFTIDALGKLHRMQ